MLNVEKFLNVWVEVGSHSTSKEDGTITGHDKPLSVQVTLWYQLNLLMCSLNMLCFCNISYALPRLNVCILVTLSFP